LKKTTATVCIDGLIRIDTSLKVEDLEWQTCKKTSGGRAPFTTLQHCS